jgi:hypothetical protein
MSEMDEVWWDSGGWEPPKDPNETTLRCFTDADLAAHDARVRAEALAPIEDVIARREAGEARMREREPQDYADHQRWYHARFGTDEPLTIRVTALRAAMEAKG